MNSEEFINGIKIGVVESSIKSIKSMLVNPPGRKPDAGKVEMSKWFANRSESDSQMVMQIVAESINLSIFNFLCILDGVSFIEDSEKKGKFNLFFEKDGNSILLNDFNEEFLHDIFNSE